MPATLPTLDTTIRIDGSTYKSDLGTVRQRPYEIQTSSSFQPLPEGTTYNQLVEQMKSGAYGTLRISSINSFVPRLTAASEELAKQLELESNGINPRTDPFFKDLWGSKQQHTLTELRLPKRLAPNYDPFKPDRIDAQGRRYWVREVLIDDVAVAEIYVPEGESATIVVEWGDNALFGLPSITSERVKDREDENYITHFGFDPNAIRAEVVRGMSWYKGRKGNRLEIYAVNGRWNPLIGQPLVRLTSAGDLVLPEFERNVA